MSKGSFLLFSLLSFRLQLNPFPPSFQTTSTRTPPAKLPSNQPFLSTFFFFLFNPIPFPLTTRRQDVVHYRLNVFCYPSSISISSRHHQSKISSLIVSERSLLSVKSLIISLNQISQNGSLLPPLPHQHPLRTRIRKQTSKTSALSTVLNPKHKP